MCTLFTSFLLNVVSIGCCAFICSLDINASFCLICKSLIFCLLALVFLYSTENFKATLSMLL